MDKVIVASLRKSAGKSSIIAGLAKASGSRIGYLKPFGDRPVYEKKRLWDHDSSTMAKILKIEQETERMPLGFHHAKLRYAYDEAAVRNKIREAAEIAGQGAKMTFVEAGPDLAYGSSVHLDATSLALHLDAPLLAILSGDDDMVRDDAVFLRRYLQDLKVNCVGIIINKIPNLEDFKNAHLDSIQREGFNLLGVIPRCDELNYFTLANVREALLARVVTGDQLLGRVIRNVFIGVMSADAAVQSAEFNKQDTLIITSGDRSDLILAAMERGAAGVVITGNSMPPANIIGLSADHNIPILMVPFDTHRASRMIDDLEPLLHPEDDRKLELLTKLVWDHVKVSALL